MRRLYLVAILVLSGCTGLEPSHTEDPQPISVYDYDPYTLLGATDARPLHWAVFHGPNITPDPNAIEHVSSHFDQLYEASSHERLLTMDANSPPATDGTWTFAELVQLSGVLRARIADAGGPAMIIVWLDGESAPDLGNLAGVAIDNSAFIFAESLGVAKGPLFGAHSSDPSRAVAERAVALHEVGHVLGLVGHGIPAGNSRQTTADNDRCACHSTNPDSVMRAGIGTVDGILAVALDGYVPDTFDADDWGDLRHARRVALA